MIINANNILFSPSDLVLFEKSAFAAWMERLERSGINTLASKDEPDEMMCLLSGLGTAHEVTSLDSLDSAGKSIYRVDTHGSYPEQEENTLKAMREGFEVIYQARLQLNEFAGYADFLVKVEGDSSLGNYHYEVWDSKLARVIKTSYTIQLCAYQEMLEAYQGRRSVFSRLILGNGTIESIETEQYFSYYCLLKSRFLDFHKTFDPKRRPHPFDSTEHGNWTAYAEAIFDQEDHLCRVAGITRNQIKKLHRAGIYTMVDLANTTSDEVANLNPEILGKLKGQASIQVRSRGLDKPLIEPITDPERIRLGLGALPPASSEDVFFDIEGFPLDEGGLEYLWGVSHYEQGDRVFRAFWAHDMDEERVAFESFIDWVYSKWQSDRSMHIYHYASYEITACKKLMGRWGTREFEVDELLRNGVFIDLYGLVKNSFLLGEPRYSIKNVEHLYREARQTEVGNGGDSVVVYQEWRELNRRGIEGKTPEDSKILHAIMDYNIDDCNSTEELVRWLRDLQQTQGIAFQGKDPQEEGELEAKKPSSEISHLRDTLLNSEDDVQHLLAYCCEFHQRENKTVYWKLFERLSKTDMELYDDIDCLAMCKRTLTYGKATSAKARNLAYEFSFDPTQPYRGQSPSRFYLLGQTREDGWTESLEHAYDLSDFKKGLVYLKCKEKPGFSKITLVPDEVVNPSPIPESIIKLAQSTLGQFEDSALIQFLRRNPPSIKGHIDGTPLLNCDLPLLPQVIQLAMGLNDSYLVIQGPPGAGKSYTAKHIMAEFLKRGMRVGICSNSHKAIHHLLISTAEFCHKMDIPSQFIVSKDLDDDVSHLKIQVIANNKISKSLEDQPGACCVGTTAWGFSRDDLRGQFDVLFIDEAGQVSIANLIGISPSARNLIMLGDQMQLPQPTQGVHPGDSGLSILDYLMKGKATIENHMGIFLDLTYRCHSSITKRISQCGL